MLRDTLVKRWMVSAICGAFSPTGVSAAGVLTFQGDQYLGKTKWFKSLVPPEKNLVKDGFILRPDDRDSVKQCLSYWLVELGELDSTFRRADISALKAFLTQQDDVLRVAYARRESKFARRTVFFGSVNPKVFLHDPTGNRRYWTIEAEHLDHSHGLDMQQVWAQVHGLYASGFGHYLTIDELNALNDHNDNFTASDPVEDVLSNHLDWDISETFWSWKSATDILKEAGFDRPTKPDVNSCANLLRKLNGNKTKRTNNSRLLFVPPSVIK
jgi:putative DNA primase/helicase